MTEETEQQFDREKINQLKQVLLPLIADMALPVIAVYVHGSWATPYERAESDLDLAMIAKRKLSYDERIVFIQKLSACLNVNNEIDLADLYGANDVFVVQVLERGTRIYAKKPEADQYEMKALASYARLNEERREILHDIATRGAIFGSNNGRDCIK